MGDRESQLKWDRPVTALPKVAFIATREPSYSRVAIVRQGLEEHFCVIPFVSELNSYPLRIVVVVTKFALALLTGRLRRVDILFVGFFGQPILPIVWLFWRGPIIGDGYFSIYDTLVFDKAKVASTSLLAKLCYWLDRFMLRKCDLVLTDTMQHVRYMKEHFDVPEARVERLWISAQDEVFTPTPPLKLLETERCEVLFWGGFIPLQGVEFIVRAAARLRGSRIHFTLVGEGQTYSPCRFLADELDVDNVSFMTWQPGERLRELAAQSHLVLGIFGTTPKAARVIPNKAFEALALGKPLITGDSAAVRELLEDGRDALLVPLGDPDALARRLIWAANDYESALRIGSSGHATFVETASPKCVSELLRDYVLSATSGDAEQVVKATTNLARSGEARGAECRQDA